MESFLSYVCGCKPYAQIRWVETVPYSLVKSTLERMLQELKLMVRVECKVPDDSKTKFQPRL